MLQLLLNMRLIMHVMCTLIYPHLRFYYRAIILRWRDHRGSDSWIILTIKTIFLNIKTPYICTYYHYILGVKIHCQVVGLKKKQETTHFFLTLFNYEITFYKTTYFFFWLSATYLIKTHSFIWYNLHWHVLLIFIWQIDK
jgi:hypothetical protein